MFTKLVIFKLTFLHFRKVQILHYYGILLLDHGFLSVFVQIHECVCVLVDIHACVVETIAGYWAFTYL